MPKYFSKNILSLSMTACFFLVLAPPPKRETGGISLSMSVPEVLISPSRNALSRNLRVSSGFNFYLYFLRLPVFASIHRANPDIYQDNPVNLVL